MTQAMRIVLKDAGAAFAVLSLYLLTLLAPLHQAQASQDAFGVLGYESVSGWSVCVSTEPEPGQPDSIPGPCPLAATHVLADAASGSEPFGLGIAGIALPPSANDTGAPAIVTGAIGARAPPVLV